VLVSGHDPYAVDAVITVGAGKTPSPGSQKQSATASP
jgi:hypothetical protein